MFHVDITYITCMATRVTYQNSSPEVAHKPWRQGFPVTEGLLLLLVARVLSWLELLIDWMLLNANSKQGEILSQLKLDLKN